VCFSRRFSRFFAGFDGKTRFELGGKEFFRREGCKVLTASESDIGFK
jgi:hypothetical protein